MTRMIQSQTYGRHTVKVCLYHNKGGGPEYAVNIYYNGRLRRDASYYTDDRHDALATSKRMLEAQVAAEGRYPAQVECLRALGLLPN